MSRALLVGVLIVSSCAGQELKVVRNAPFTATAVTNNVQTLTDGNKITRTTNVFIARDSEGRTRREQGNGVFIVDPVASTGYVLDTKSHTVRRFAAQSRSGAPATEIRSGPGEETRVMEGLPVEGSHLQHIIRPGEAGNTDPIEIVSEIWYSSELQEPVLTRTVDPRTGETTSQLKDIRRAEPAHTLFEVPVDFSVVEGLSIPLPTGSSGKK
jgi:hypothetical protein